MKNLFLTIPLLLIALSANAQDIDIIKKSSKYYYGVGEAPTREAAYEMAIKEISKQAYLAVESDDISKIDIKEISLGKDGHKSFREETLQSSVNMESDILMTDVNVIELPSDNYSYKLFCYIKKSDVTSKTELQKQRIQRYVQGGIFAERNLQLNDALRFYYWALALCSIQHESVLVDIGGVEQADGRIIIPSKIKDLLHRIKAEVKDYDFDNGVINCRIHFTYDGHDISSIDFRYYDGHDTSPMISCIDGISEIRIFDTEAKEIRIDYELLYTQMAKSIDSDVFNTINGERLSPISSSVRIPINIKEKKGIIVQTGEQKMDILSNGMSQNEEYSIEAEAIYNPKQIAAKNVESNDIYQDKIALIEQSIKAGDPRIAQDCFSEEGYLMFYELMTRAKVSLCGKSDYQYIESGLNEADSKDQVIARSCLVNIKFSKRTFTEKLVFRFSKNDQLIHSIALSLTKKAYSSIMNANLGWEDESRFTITNFLEDYQTAYFLRRLDFISKIYSDRAIIIVGTVLKNATPNPIAEEELSKLPSLNSEKVKYERFAKEDFLERLKVQFKEREYIHLTFEESVSNLVNTHGFTNKEGDAYVIQISQRYDSPVYSDQGYLTLILNMTEGYPLIEVRLWQPYSNKRLMDEIVDINTFADEFFNMNIKRE